MVKWKQIIEWIEYNKFENIEYLAKGGFGTIFKAVWKDGPWEINYGNDQLIGKRRQINSCFKMFA